MLPSQFSKHTSVTNLKTLWALMQSLHEVGEDSKEWGPQARRAKRGQVFQTYMQFLQNTQDFANLVLVLELKISEFANSPLHDEFVKECARLKLVIFRRRVEASEIYLSKLQYSMMPYGSSYLLDNEIAITEKIRSEIERLRDIQGTEALVARFEAVGESLAALKTRASALPDFGAQAS